MRYKFTRLSSTMGGLTFIVVCLSAISLFFKGQLNLYIHPRYSIFTFVLISIGLSLWVIGILRARKEHAHAGENSVSYFTLAICGGIILCLLLLPAKTLSSRTAQNRTTNVATRTSATRVSLARNTDSIKMEGWVSLLSQPSDRKLVVGKTAKISGFIMSDPIHNDQLLISRFIVTCCAVDASPIQITAKYNNWKKDFMTDDWVEADGKFTESNGEIVLDVDSLKKIQRPKDPYAY